MKRTALSATEEKRTRDEQFLEEVVRGVVTDVKMRRLNNLGMLVRRLEQAIKEIDDSRAAIKPSTEN